MGMIGPPCGVIDRRRPWCGTSSLKVALRIFMSASFIDALFAKNGSGFANNGLFDNFLHVAPLAGSSTPESQGFVCEWRTSLAKPDCKVTVPTLTSAPRT